jgi:hypothetical protein
MAEQMLRGILADRYHVEKLPADVDTIVIGSGMGGLRVPPCSRKWANVCWFSSSTTWRAGARTCSS